MRLLLSYMTDDEKLFFLESIATSGNIAISERPATDAMTIDDLYNLYEEFPFVEQYDLFVPIKDSNSNIRFVKARRKAIVGMEYYYRLKQIAEEKFSATSLSATNLRGENTKSKANKNWLIMNPNTPIRFGNMEFNDMGHLGIEQVIENLMIHSVSPQARQGAEKLYVCNPFDINVDLEKEAKNIVAEQVMTYMKAMGKRLRFVKVPKFRISPITINPLKFVRSPIKYPLFIVNEDMKKDKNFDAAEAMRIQNEIENGDPERSPIEWAGTDTEINKQRLKKEKLAQQTKDMNPRQRFEFLKKLGIMKD